MNNSASHGWAKHRYTIAYALRHGWLWILAGLLVLVSISLSFAYVQTTTPQGGKRHWPENYATLNLRLGCPTPGPPLMGTLLGRCGTARRPAVECRRGTVSVPLPVAESASRRVLYGGPD